MVESSTRTTQKHACHGFKPRMEKGLTIRLRGNELSLESLYRPACLRRTLRQIEEEEYVALERHLYYFQINK